ncbi:MAG: hypothetical protein KL863_15875 [Rhizobium sp.]|nr:hypothetical protein [Rhizobium sp.]
MYYSVRVEIIDGDWDFEVQMPLGPPEVGVGRDLYNKALGTLREQEQKIEGFKAFNERMKRNIEAYISRMSEGSRVLFEFDNWEIMHGQLTSKDNPLFIQELDEASLERDFNSVIPIPDAKPKEP